MFRHITIAAAIAVASNAAIAKDLTAAEKLAAQLSAKTGLSFEVRTVSIGPDTAKRRPATQHRPVFVSSQHSSPSLVDLSAHPPGYRPKPAAPDPGAFSAKIEARGYQMFPLDSQREERGRWMAEQEQREIANEINRSKPLIYPAR